MNAPGLEDNQLPQMDEAHVIGDRGTELWRRTIPDLFKETVASFSEREAAVFFEQGVRWTWSELDREVTWPPGAWPHERRPCRYLVSEPLRMDSDAIRDGAAGLNSGHDQSSLPCD